MARNNYVEVFNRHFESLEVGLKMNLLYPTFVKKGLLEDLELREVVRDPNKGNFERVRRFLDWIKDSLQISNKRFILFLEALREYDGDGVINDLANSILKDLNPALENEPQKSNIQVSADTDLNITHLKKKFEECESLVNAFIMLTSEVKKFITKGDFSSVKQSCLAQCNNPGGAKLPKSLIQRIRKCSDYNSLIESLGTTAYWNVFDIRLLEGMATASLQENARTVISIFKKVVYSQSISKYFQRSSFDSPNKDQQDISFYTKIKERCDKDPESFTIGDVVSHRNYLEKRKLGIEGFVAFLGYDWGSLIFFWLIPTTMVHYAYNSAKTRQFFPDGIISLEIFGYPAITFPSENTVLGKELQKIEHQHTVKSSPADTLDAYYKVLVHLMDAESVGQLMVSRKLISKDDLSAITAGAPSDYLRNSHLLELVEQLDLSHRFFSLLQESSAEINKFIGDHLLKSLEDTTSNTSESSDDDASSNPDHSNSSVTVSPVSIGTKRKQPDHFDDTKSIKHAKVSRSYSIQFGQLLHKLYELFQSVKVKDVILFLTQLLADNSNKIHLFSQKELLEYNKCDTVSEVLKRLRHCWTWYDHIMLKELIKALHISEAVELLNNFDSSFDASQPLTACPFPDVSSSLAVYDHSAFTLLATKHDVDFSALLLQNVDDLKSMLVEKFDITKHCVQLVAVNSNPTVLFWMIPKCVAPIVSAKVQEHCNFLYSQNISEVAIYPNTIIVTNGSLRVGLLAYLSEKLIDRAKDDNSISLLREIKELPDLLSSLQTDLAKSKEESNSFQMKLEEYQITNEIKQEIETEASEEITVLKDASKRQREELSEKESHLLVIKTEMENLQKQNKSLTKQYAELKCEKNALDIKVKTLEKQNTELNANLQELKTELSHLQAQENHQTVKEIEAELQRKNEDNSSLCKKNEELVSKLQRSQKEIDIMQKDIQENDRPTMEQLSLLVLSQWDVVQNWSQLDFGLNQNRHNRQQFTYKQDDLDPVMSCQRVLENWIEGQTASWRYLLLILNEINLKNAAARIASLLPGYRKKEAPTMLIDFSLFENVQQIFQKLITVITSLLRVTSIIDLRRACIIQSSGPSAVKFSEDLIHDIRSAKNIDSLMDVLAFRGLLTWTDTRLLETLASVSSIPEPLQLIKDYKSFVYAKNMFEILPNSPDISTKRAYVQKLCCKINVSADELTVHKLMDFTNVLEAVILDINEGLLVIDRIKEGCIEIHFYIPVCLFRHAYQSALENTKKFSNLHIRYLDFNGYPKIYAVQSSKKQMYNDFSLPLTDLSPNKLIQYYSQYLIENMDSDSVSHVMFSKKLLTKADVKIMHGFSDNGYRNSLILKFVVNMNIPELFSFCEILLDMEHQHCIGTLLVNGLKSTGISKYSCYPSIPRPVSLKCCKETRSTTDMPLPICC